MTTVLHLDAVTRVHGSGPTEVTALKSVTFRAHAGELVAIMGPSGLRQVHAPHPRRRARPADRRAGERRGRRPGHARQQGTGADPAYVDRLRLPGLQPDPRADRGRERRPAAGARRRADQAPPARSPRPPSTRSGSATSLPGSPTRCPAASSSGSRSPARSSGDRRLILADEPTGALDTETGEEILRMLRSRCDAGAAGVLVTHEARHAAWADRVVFLRDGIVVDESGADPAEVLLESGAR